MSLRSIHKFLLAGIGLMLLAYGAGGCKFFGGGEAPKADWVTFKGSAVSPESLTTSTLARQNPSIAPILGESFRATEFESTARSPLPSVRADAAQREAFARVEARRAALRSLAEKILVHTPEGSSKNMSLILERLPSGTAGLEPILESFGKVTYAKSADAEAIDARATLSGAAISDVYGNRCLADMIAAASEQNKNLNPEERKALAEAEALESARSKAFARVLGIQSSVGSMSSLVEKDPKLGEELHNWIYAAKPEAFKHSADGVCETAIKLDMQKPFDMIAKQTKQSSSAKKKTEPKKSDPKKTESKSKTKTKTVPKPKPKPESNSAPAAKDEPLPAAPLAGSEGIVKSDAAKSNPLPTPEAVETPTPLPEPLPIPAPETPPVVELPQ